MRRGSVHNNILTVAAVRLFLPWRYGMLATLQTLDRGKFALLVDH